MKIGVLIKGVIDPDDPLFIIENNQRKGDKVVISTYDENALEVALKLKDKDNSIEVNVITITDKDFSQGIKKALAMGADKAIVINNSENLFLDTFSIANILSKIIKEEGFDIILTGFESADWSSRTIASYLAAKLNYNYLTFCHYLELIENNNKVLAYKIFNDDEYIIQTKLPALFSITTHPNNIPRYPKVKDIMLASKKPIKNLNISEFKDLIKNYIDLYKTELVNNEIECMIIEGDTPEIKAQKLVSKLKELKII